MGLRRAKATGPFGIGGEVEKEAQTVKPGCVRYTERTINGKKVTIIFVNRTERFQILALSDGGKIETLWDGNEAGKKEDGK